MEQPTVNKTIAFKPVFISIIALLIMGTGFGVLAPLQKDYQLSKPGIRINHCEGLNCDIELPSLPNYSCEQLMPSEIELAMLPKDTSIAKGIYTSEDGVQILVNVVLMGTDRTSIHKPEFCVTSQGWQIVEDKVVKIPIQSPLPYELEVRQFITSKLIRDRQGSPQILRGIFTFWFVADDRITSSHFQRIWWTMLDLVRKKMLKRWAYIGCFIICMPGEEDKAFEHLKTFLKDFVPQFHLVPAT